MTYMELYEATKSIVEMDYWINTIQEVTESYMLIYSTL